MSALHETVKHFWHRLKTCAIADGGIDSDGDAAESNRIKRLD